MINLDNRPPGDLAEVTAAFYQYEEALVSTTSRYWMRYSGTTRAPYGWEPAKICMASRRSAPFAPPARRRSGPRSAPYHHYHLWRGYGGAAPSSPAKAARWAASSRPGYASYGWRIVAARVSLMD